jgi:hypothetical protein
VVSVKPLKPGPFTLEATVADAGGNLTVVKASATVSK